MVRKLIYAAWLCAIMTANATAYDSVKAKEFNEFYSHFTLKALAASKTDISADETMQMIRENKKFTFLDIRTRAEMNIIGITAPNTLEIEMENLFDEKNLNALPKDELVIIICHSGSRAMVAATSLNMLGFTNIRVLKGGIKAFADAVGTDSVPIK